MAVLQLPLWAMTRRASREVRALSNAINLLGCCIGIANLFIGVVLVHKVMVSDQVFDLVGTFHCSSQQHVPALPRPLVPACSRFLGWAVGGERHWEVHAAGQGQAAQAAQHGP
jgi:hypothetical protein